MQCILFSLIHETIVASLRELENEHCPPDQPRVPDVAVAQAYCYRNQTQRQDV